MLDDVQEEETLFHCKGVQKYQTDDSETWRRLSLSIRHEVLGRLSRHKAKKVTKSSTIMIFEVVMQLQKTHNHPPTAYTLVGYIWAVSQQESRIRS